MTEKIIGEARIYGPILEPIYDALRALAPRPGPLILAFEKPLALTATAGRTALQALLDVEARGGAALAVDDAEGLLKALIDKGDWATIQATPTAILADGKEFTARPPTHEENEVARLFEEARQYPAKLAATLHELKAILEPPGSKTVLFESRGGRVRIQRDIGGARLSLVKEWKTGEAAGAYPAGEVLAVLKALRKAGPSEFVLAFSTGKSLVVAAESPSSIAALAMPLGRP